MQRFAFQNPNFEHLHVNILTAARRGLPVARHGELDGARVAILGTGPTLTSKRLREVGQLAASGWQVWPLKEALSVLTEAGVPCHATVAMDPDAGQVAKYPRVHGVTYWLASSCDPALFDHLVGLDLRVFHSACGWHGTVPHPESGERVPISEIDIYRYAYGRGDCVVGGYTVANRALGLAKFLGAGQVRLYGTPFGWRDDGYYASGVQGPAGNEGRDLVVELPGQRPWRSRPDLVASAIHVATAIRCQEVEVVGSSLASDIAAQPDAIVRQLFPGQWPFSSETVPHAQEA